MFSLKVIFSRSGNFYEEVTALKSLVIHFSSPLSYNTKLRLSTKSYIQSLVISARLKPLDLMSFYFKVKMHAV